MTDDTEVRAWRDVPIDLISAAISGNDLARERLIRTIWPQCFRLAAAVIGDWNLANDAAQEACIAAHRHISSLRDASAFNLWIYRIVVREAKRIRRRHAIAPTEIYGDGFPIDPSLNIDVWRALGSLPPAFRDVTVLYYFDDLTTQEIADILAVPHATVRTRLSRARDQLRELLGDYASVSNTKHGEVTCNGS